MTADTRPAPPIPASVEDQARELLAAEFERDAPLLHPNRDGAKLIREGIILHPKAVQMQNSALRALASQSAKLIEVERERDDLFAKLAERAEAHGETISKLAKAVEALRPFAMIAEKGRDGGRFVIAKALYEDMKSWDEAAPRQSHWHWNDFDHARQALADLQDKGEGK